MRLKDWGVKDWGEADFLVLVLDIWDLSGICNLGFGIVAPRGVLQLTLAHVASARIRRPHVPAAPRACCPQEKKYSLRPDAFGEDRGEAAGSGRGISGTEALRAARPACCGPHDIVASMFVVTLFVSGRCRSGGATAPAFVSIHLQSKQFRQVPVYQATHRQPPVSY